MKKPDRMVVEMVALDDLKEDPDNPRRADPERLDMVELSLSRLGFLLPLYIAEDNEILSGHQRSSVARRMGATHVPCVRVPLDDKKRTGINLIFNRATNDMSREDQGETMKQDLAGSIVIASAEHMPRLDMNDWETWCPVLNAVETPVQEIVDRDGGWVNDRYAVTNARALTRKRVFMPIVVTESGKIINGWGRVVEALEIGRETLPVVTCPDDRAELASLLLNRLSMDFVLEDRYADVLRYNSFRRSRGVTGHLTGAFGCLFLKMMQSASKKKLRVVVRDLKPTEQNISIWKRIHGEHVVDFGCGLGDKSRELRDEWGVDVAMFEPYWTGGKDSGFALEEGRAMNREFLMRVAQNDRFDTVFLSSVHNSVPFRRDRELVCAVAHALVYGHDGAQVISAAQAYQRYLADKDPGNKKSASQKFTLGYESGVILADVQETPKMQKFHTPAEYRTLWGRNFYKVDVWGGDQVYAHCRMPKPIDVDELSQALAFEFELPFPNNEYLGLGAEAFDAFEARLGIELDRSYLDRALAEQVK